MSRKAVTAALLLIDSAIIVAATYLALYIRFDGNVESQYYEMITTYLPFVLVVRLCLLYLCGLYNRLWRYAGVRELLMVVGSVTLSSLILVMIVPGLPRSVHILGWLINIILIGGSRLFIRILYYLRASHIQQDCSNVLIIGAGDAGAMIAREMQNSRYLEDKKLIGFIDDDNHKQQQKLFGAKVLGTRQDIIQVADQWDVNEIIIAMPSADGQKIREIVNECKKTACTVNILPGMYELIDGKVTVQQLRNVDLEDLLRRDPVKLDLEKIAGYLSGKRVLVTGAGGSIGSELCRQIAKTSPHLLILLGRGENSIFDIDRDLRAKYPELFIIPIIADIRDKERIMDVFSDFKPQVVFHAAAHKHVPLMEVQPVEALRNNVFGTQNVVDAADRIGTEIFVMVSTDKAVNPTSVMGATKRMAELIVQNMSQISSTKFVTVRFGNVLGSRGSVIPLFKKQIAEGGPITVTHPEMKRYFMTIPEACQLVLQAGTMAHGDEVFVLDMGQPVKILDMARDLIELSGFTPDRDIQIEFTGIRPGEKLFEEILTAEEGTLATKHDKIYVANLKPIDQEILYKTLAALKQADQAEDIIRLMMRIIPTYESGSLQTATPGQSGGVVQQGVFGLRLRSESISI